MRFSPRALVLELDARRAISVAWRFAPAVRPILARRCQSLAGPLRGRERCR